MQLLLVNMFDKTIFGRDITRFVRNHAEIFGYLNFQNLAISVIFGRKMKICKSWKV